MTALTAEERLSRIRIELDRDIRDGLITPARADWFYSEARLACRATVERIRSAVDWNVPAHAELEQQLAAILDEEAAR